MPAQFSVRYTPANPTVVIFWSHRRAIWTVSFLNSLPSRTPYSSQHSSGWQMSNPVRLEHGEHRAYFRPHSAEGIHANKTMVLLLLRRNVVHCRRHLGWTFFSFRYLSSFRPPHRRFRMYGSIECEPNRILPQQYFVGLFMVDGCCWHGRNRAVRRWFGGRRLRT